MTVRSSTPTSLRALVALLALVAVAFLLLSIGGGYAQGQTDAQVQERTQELEAAIRAETRRIGRTQEGLNGAQVRLNAINADLAKPRAKRRPSGISRAASRGTDGCSPERNPPTAVRYRPTSSTPRSCPTRDGNR